MIERKHFDDRVRTSHDLSQPFEKERKSSVIEVEVNGVNVKKRIVDEAIDRLVPDVPARLYDLRNIIDSGNEQLLKPVGSLYSADPESVLKQLQSLHDRGAMRVPIVQHISEKPIESTEPIKQ